MSRDERGEREIVFRRDVFSRVESDERAKTSEKRIDRGVGGVADFVGPTRGVRASGPTEKSAFRL